MDTMRLGRPGICGWILALGVVAGCAQIRPYLPDNPFFSPEVPGDIRKIAVLPFAFRDEHGVQSCSLCPNPLVMAPTSQDASVLTTALFYEALTHHPRFEVLPFETVARFVGDTMEESTERLQVMAGIDAVLVGAILELRPRVGDPQGPDVAAGAAVYAALVDARSHRALWHRVIDRTQNPANAARKSRDMLFGDEGSYWLSAEGMIQKAAAEMMRDMARTVR